MNSKEKILDLILTSPTPLSCRDIAEETSLRFNTVQKLVVGLHQEDLIGRVPGPRNTWLYTRDIGPAKEKQEKTREKKPAAARPATKGVSLKELEKFLKVMTQKRWVHPIFQEEITLNRSMLRMFGLAYEKATGGDVNDTDLQGSRDNLEALWRKLQEYADFLSAILKQGYLWDSSTFANWLTENHTAEELREMVREAREHN